MTKEWIRRRKHDSYYRKAKSEGYRSRATYKLKEMDERLRLMKKGYKVLDLGASPGGWSQYASEMVGEGGIVVAVDMESMESIPNVQFIKGDVGDEEAIGRIMEISPEFDLVISDISPSLSGNKILDRGRTLALAWSVMKVSLRVLRKNGNVIVKMFQGDETDELKEEFAKYFWRVENLKPRSSVKRSIEMYLAFRGYIGRQEE